MRLILFTAGDSPRATRAKANIQALIDDHSELTIDLQLIDLLDDPDAATTHNILAIPTLMREEPAPAVKLVGDLSDRPRVWEVLSN